jgi:hypothetical protein
MVAPSPGHPARPDALVRIAAFASYGLGLLLLLGGLYVRPDRSLKTVHTLQRALSRGEVGPDIPRLDANDAMANAAVLNAALSVVTHPGLHPSGPVAESAPPCALRARSFAVFLAGRLSRVRFGARSVCQLARLKQISLAQPGFGPRGLAEVPAFVLGRRLSGGEDVDVTRIIVPPFRFGGDSLTFEAANLGPLQEAERFIGTYHTHPEDDVTQGVLSETDLDYMQNGFVDFAGAVGPLDRPSPHLDWLFDIVEPRDGAWNVYAHDAERLATLRERCVRETPCPLNELRLAGSPYNLFARVYEERDDDL